MMTKPFQKWKNTNCTTTTAFWKSEKYQLHNDNGILEMEKYQLHDDNGILEIGK